MDKFRVEVLRSTPNPQQTIWSAMHQDYCEDLVWEQRETFPEEQKAGELVIKHLLAGGRGHYGPLEHPQIVFNVGYFPHSMMQQIRTHRVGISFDVQCLAGETAISLKQTDKGEPISRNIKALYELGAADPNIFKTLEIVVFDEEQKTFTTGKIQGVVCSGAQPVYRLTLSNGQSLDCTTEHKILTTNGWQTMAAAIGLEGSVPHKERMKRAKMLRILSEKKLRRFYEDHLGHVATVLFEQKNAKGFIEGFTENYIRVAAPYAPHYRKTFMRQIMLNG